MERIVTPWPKKEDEDDFVVAPLTWEEFISGPEKKEEQERPPATQYYPGALPSPDADNMGALRDSLYQDAGRLLNEEGDPRYKGLLPGGSAELQRDAATVAEPPTTTEPPTTNRKVTPWPKVSRKQQVKAPTWEDYGRMFASGGPGLAAGLGWAMKQVGAEELGEAIQVSSNEVIQKLMEGLSPQAQQAMQTAFLERDDGELWTDNKWNRVKLQTFQSIIGTTAGLGVGSLLTKGLAKAGMKKAVTTTAGETIQAPTGAAAALGYGLGEAFVSAPSSGAGAEAEVLAMTHEQLMQESIEYIALYENADPALSEEQARQMAKKKVADAVGGSAAGLTALTTFMLSSPAGYVLNKYVGPARKAQPHGRIKGGIKAGGTETVQEFAQSGAEQLSENIALRFAGGFENQALSENVLESATGGALSGYLMGSTMGVIATPGGPAPIDGDTDTDTGARPISETGPGGVLIDDTGDVDYTPPQGLSETLAQGDLSTVQDTRAPDPVETTDGVPESTRTKLEGLNTEASALPTDPVDVEATLKQSALEQEAAEAAELAARDAETNLETEQAAASLETEPAAASLETEVAEESETAPVVSPMVTAKEVEEGFRELSKRTGKKSDRSVRKAMQSFSEAIALRFPDAELPSLTHSVGPKRFGQFFQTLDEQVDLSVIAPNLKEGLATVTASADANTAIANIEALQGYIQNTATPIPRDKPGSIIEQAREGINNYDASKTKQKGRKRSGVPVKQQRATAINELASVVEALVEEANKFGIPLGREVLGNPKVKRKGKNKESKETELFLNPEARVQNYITAARNFIEKAHTPSTRITRGGAGSKTIDWRFTDDELNVVGQGLRNAAEAIANKIIEARSGTLRMGLESSEDSVLGKGEAKGTPKESVTAAPVEAKTEAAPKKPINKPHKQQSTAEWVRSFVRPGGKMGVAAGTQAAIEENLKILEEAKHPEAAMLRKQIEKTKFNELTPASEKMAAGTEVVYKPSKWKMTFKPTATGKVAQMDTSSIIAGFDTKQEAMEHGRAIKKELGGGTFEVIKDPDYVTPKKPAAPTKGDKAKESAEKLSGNKGRFQKSDGPSIIDLKKEAKALGLKRYSALNKDELVALIAKAKEAPVEKEPTTPKVKMKGRRGKRLGEQKLKPAKAYTAPEEKPKRITLESNKPIVSAGASTKVTKEIAEALEKDIELGKGGLDRALDAANIRKEAGNALRNIYENLPDKKRRRFIAAINEYKNTTGTAEAKLRLAAQINDFTGSEIEIDSDVIVEIIGFTDQLMARMDAISPEELEKERLREAESREEFAREEGYDSYEQMLDYLSETTNTDEDQKQAETDWDLPPDEQTHYSVATSLSNNIKKEAVKLSKILQSGLFADLVWPNMGRSSENIAVNRDAPPLKQPTPVSSTKLLDALIKTLPKNNSYFQLARRLRDTGVDIPVYIVDDLLIHPSGSLARGMYHSGGTPENRSAWISFNQYEAVPTWEKNALMITTLMHELVHAVTVRKYATDELFRAKIDALLETARAKTKETMPGVPEKVILEEFPGLKGGYEFIAYGLTEADFQLLLVGIPSRGSFGRNLSNLLKDFVDAIKKMLGYSVRNTLLEDLIILTDENIQTEEEIIKSYEENQGKGVWVAEDEPDTFPSIVPNSPYKRNRDAIDAEINNTALSLKRIGGLAYEKTEFVKRLFSPKDAIERDARALFDKAGAAANMTNPVSRLLNAMNSAGHIARVYEVKAAEIFKKLQKLDVQAWNQIQVVMRDVTMGNVWAHKPLEHKLNQHLWGKNGLLLPSKKAKAEYARAQFLKLEEEHPAAAKLLVKAAELTKQIHEMKIAKALYALAEAYGFDQKTVNAFEKAKTSEDIKKLIPDNEENIVETKLDALKNSKLDKKSAAYKEQLAELEELMSAATARAKARETAVKILEMSFIEGMYFPLRRYGDYVVSTINTELKKDETYVAFFDNVATAEEHARNLNRQEGQPKVHVSVKLEAKYPRGDVEDIVSDLSQRLKGQPGSDKMVAAMKGAMSELLASNAAYASQARRESIEGVAAPDMSRALEEYVKVSTRQIGGLMIAHKVTRALRDLGTVMKNESGVLKGAELTRAKVIYREILAQRDDDAKANNQEWNKYQKFLGTIGFFNYLGSPNYWVLNATQTYVVTIPWLGAKYGYKESTPTLLNAQKMVLKAVAAGMKSSDKSYEGFKAQLPKNTRKLVELLEENDVIQSNIAHQLGEMISPTLFNSWRRSNITGAKQAAASIEFGVDIMQKIPEAIEHFNRISTGIAAYQLSGGDLRASIDAVNSTQFNYDTFNRARGLKGNILTPIMMFKTFGFGMFRLFYGGLGDVLSKNSTKQERREGAKLMAGLMMTHTIAAGVHGGVMLAPVLAFQAIINSMREPDDEWDIESSIKEFADDVAGSYIADILHRGIFAGIGVDLSGSISLNNMLWMSNENADYTMGDELKAGAYDLVTGPLGAYFANIGVEVKRLGSDDAMESWWKFAEAAIPLKFARGVSQAIRYNVQGVTSGDLQLLSPEEFSALNGGIQTMLGFQSSAKTSIQFDYYRDVKLERKRNERKSRLVRKLQDKLKAGDDISGVLNEITKYSLSVPKASMRINLGDRAKLVSRRRKAQQEFNRRYRYAD